MRIKDHMFPYPVLRDRQDDYVKTHFKASVESVIGDKELKLNVRMECTNMDVLALVTNGQARYALHLECKMTYYRQLYYSDKPCFSVSLPSHLVDLQVEVCPLIVATQNISGYQSTDLDDAYEGEELSFRCGDFIAVGNQFTVPIIRKNDELKQLSAPFCLLVYPEGEEQKYTRLEYSQENQVVIYVPKEVHPIIANVQGGRDKMDELHAALFFPALMQTIEFMRSEEGASCEEKRWYIAINQRAIEKGVGEIRESTEDAYVIAQKIFDYPLTRWLKKLPTNDEGA